MNYKKAVEEVVSWLNGDRNYQLGISFLKSYGKNIQLANSLEKFKNKAELEKLIWDLLKDLKKKRDCVKDEVSTCAKIAQVEKTDIKKNNKKFDDLLLEYKNNIKKINLLKSQYVLLGDNLNEENKKQRHQMGAVLLDLDFNSSELYFKIKYFEKFGILPDMNKSKEENPLVPTIEFQKKDETIRKRISKYDSKIKKAMDLIEQNPTNDFTKELKKINEWQLKMKESIIERKKINNV